MDARSLSNKKSLIVICFHNGWEWIPQLIDSLGKDKQIIVVDTGSTEEQREKLQGIASERVEIDFIDGGYAPAAYRQGFEKHPDFDEYMFLHDSMFCKDPNFLDDFRAKGEVVTWVSYPLAPVCMPCEYNLSFYPDLNIYNMPWTKFCGPIFYATGDAVRKITWPPPCKNHEELVVSESSFALAFHRAGYSIGAIDVFEDGRWDGARDYKHFDKFRVHRL